MEIGELTSKNIDTIINRLWELELRFENYCKLHAKLFTSTITLNPNNITLKCYIETVK